MNNVTSFYLAGLSFRSEAEQSAIKKGLILKFKIEPDNPYDQNAIKITTWEGINIGYVPKKQTKELHPYRICNIPLYSIVANFIPEMPVHRRVLITVQSKENLPKFISSEGNEQVNDFINLDKLESNE